MGLLSEEIHAWNILHKEVDILSPEIFKNAACKPSCQTALLDFNIEIYLNIDCTTDIGENENT